jgi:hypothetical protein
VAANMLDNGFIPLSLFSLSYQIHQKTAFFYKVVLFFGAKKSHNKE